MFYKRIIVFLVAFAMIMGVLYPISIVKAASDTKPPALNEINVDKAKVTSGDMITITVDAVDDVSGINSIQVYYKAPSGSATKCISLTKDIDGKYRSTASIGQNDAAGKWKVSFITLADSAANTINVYNSNVYSSPGIGGILKDLSSGDFEVFGTTTDTKPPTINDIKVDKTKVTNSDMITITVDAVDDVSGINSVQVYYKAPSGSATKCISLTKDIDGKYRGTVSIEQNDAAGKWKISVITLVDNATNIIDVYNSNVYSIPGIGGILKDLSSGDFEVRALNIEPLPHKCITGNESWTNTTINGDLYVGPQAVLTVNGSVSVNGNIYVIGAIQNYGNLNVTGGIYARQVIWGNSSLSNGTVLMMGGTNSVGSIVASNDPINIPLKIDQAKNNTMIAYDGKISITGATLPIIDLYIDNTKLNYYNNGTFSIDLDTSNKQKVDFKTVDVFGNEKIDSYTIINKYYDTNKDSSINIVDLANVAKGFNSKKSDSNWQDQYDYNCDGIIDIYDLVKISKKIS